MPLKIYFEILETGPAFENTNFRLLNSLDFTLLKNIPVHQEIFQASHKESNHSIHIFFICVFLQILGQKLSECVDQEKNFDRY